MRLNRLGFTVMIVLLMASSFNVLAQDAPPGCQQPPDDYTRVQIGNATLNARTLAMLEHAEVLYHASGGTNDLMLAITQGSYHDGVSASFGTHDGGGAVDISVRSQVDWAVLEDEIEPLIAALRTAGFAAWLRDFDELYAGSPIHIHAIAIGDRELSPAARLQVDGPEGYLRGYDGLPREDGAHGVDRHGGPVICPWMQQMGYDRIANKDEVWGNMLPASKSEG